MKSHLLTIITFSVFTSLTACKTTVDANKKPVTEEQQDDYYSESKYGPFDESEYTAWMNLADSQIRFDKTNFNKKLVFFSEGRNYKGLSQYRMVIKDKPDNVENFYSRTFMDERLLWQYGVEYQKKGFKRVSLQLFKDSSGVTRHQAIWFKYKETGKVKNKANTPSDN